MNHTILKTNLKDVEKKLYELEDEIPDPAVFFQESESDSIVLYDLAVYIPSLNLYLYTGEYNIYGLSDFCLTAIYEGPHAPTDRPVFWEQDGLLGTLCNYLHSKDNYISIEDLSDVDCEIVSQRYKDYTFVCPYCGSTNVEAVALVTTYFTVKFDAHHNPHAGDVLDACEHDNPTFRCQGCHHEFTEDELVKLVFGDDVERCTKRDK